MLRLLQIKFAYYVLYGVRDVRSISKLITAAQHHNYGDLAIESESENGLISLDNAFR